MSHPALVRVLAGVFSMALLVAGISSAGNAGAGDVEPGWVGFYAEPVQQLEPAHRVELGVKVERGSVVSVVVTGGPADVAGLKPGDLLKGLAGQPVPDFTPTGAGDEDARRAWHAALRKRLEALDAGVKVEVLVERAGVAKSLTLVPITMAEMHRVQGGTDPALPALASAGAPSALLADFEGLPAGGMLPDGCFGFEGRWRVVAGPDPAASAVLRQDLPTLPWAVLLVAGKGRAYADAKATVRWMALSGIADQSGGIVFRAQDAKNYYVVRSNSIEDNFRLYVVKDGVRTTLADLKVVPPSAKAWHVLEVAFTGPKMRATIDGKDAIEATDATFASGWCGLWTKADSVTLFDDFRVEPAATAK